MKVAAFLLSSSIISILILTSYINREKGGLNTTSCPPGYVIDIGWDVGSQIDLVCQLPLQPTVG